MAEPQPVQLLATGVLIGVGLLALWWVGLPMAVRERMLTRVGHEEQAPTLPPSGIWTQVEWLYTHRAGWLSRQAGLIGLLAFVGLCEGMERRRRDVRGGWLHRWWTTGVIGLVACALLVGCCLIFPWSLVEWPVGPGLACLGGIAGYGLGAGRPYVG